MSTGGRAAGEESRVWEEEGRNREIIEKSRNTSMYLYLIYDALNW